MQASRWCCRFTKVPDDQSSRRIETEYLFGHSSQVHVNLHNLGLSPHMGKGHPDDVMVSQGTPGDAVAQCHQKDL